jgi:hypothetical protein
LRCYWVLLASQQFPNGSMHLERRWLRESVSSVLAGMAVPSFI